MVNDNYEKMVQASKKWRKLADEAAAAATACNLCVKAYCDDISSRIYKFLKQLRWREYCDQLEAATPRDGELHKLISDVMNIQPANGLGGVYFGEILVMISPWDIDRIKISVFKDQVTSLGLRRV